MAKGKKTGGPVKGVPNKLTTGAKEVIAQVASNIGGVARMTAWVRESKENEKAFWTSIYTKLLPLQVAGDKDNPLSIHRIERTIVLDVGLGCSMWSLRQRMVSYRSHRCAGRRWRRGFCGGARR
jgi:hypothetical protein